MRAMWSGSIGFGLVNIPVKLFSAVSPQRVSFRLLAKEDRQPLQYKRWSPTLNKEIAWEEIVKGLKVGKGEYAVFTQEELDELRPEKSDRIEIAEFVPAQQVDPIYFDKHYYCAPQKRKEKTFYLFREVLSSSARMAIGRFVMRDKEYVCALEAYKEGILLSTLNYAYEIRDPANIETLGEEPQIREEELALAEQLIEKLAKDSFEIEKYEDTYAEQLEQSLARRERGEPARVEAPPQTREEDLIEALRASLEA